MSGMPGNKRKNARLWEAGWTLLTAALALALAAWVFRWYGMDWNVPLSFSGDGVGLLNRVAAFRSGVARESLYGAPFAETATRQLNGAGLQDAVIWLYSRICPTAGLAENLYYALGYPAAAAAMFFALRRLNASRGTACSLGLLYAFLPYHWARGIPHIYLASYYMVPLMSLCILLIAEDRPFSDALPRERGGLLRRLDRRTVLLCLLTALLMGTDISYSVFSCLLLAFAALSVWVRSRRADRLALPAVMCALMLLCILAENIPYLIGLRDGSSVSAGRSSLDLYSVYAYALRPVYLLLPQFEHRLAFFRHVMSVVFSAYPIVTEDAYTALGAVLAAGLLLSAAGVLVLRADTPAGARLRCLGSLNLAAVLLSVEGGACVLVAFVSSAIRCYNRVSVFIAAFSAMALAEVAKAVSASARLRWPSGRGRAAWRAGSALLLAGLTAFGIWDQTPATAADARESTEAAYASCKTLVEAVDERLPDGSMILMLPVVNNPDSTREGLGPYAQLVPSAFSDNLRWSLSNSTELTACARWLDNVTALEPEEMVARAAEAGFAGIWLDRQGYGEEEFAAVRAGLDGALGGPALVSAAGGQYFYDLRDYAAARAAACGAEAWAELRRESLGECWILPLSSFYTGGAGTIADGRAVSSGAEGFLFYGPYAAYEAGEYVLTMTLYLESAPSGAAGYVDAVSDKGQTQLLYRELTAGDFTDGTLALSLPVTLSGGVSDLEIRCWVPAGTSLTVSYVAFSPADGGEQDAA